LRESWCAIRNVAMAVDPRQILGAPAWLKRLPLAPSLLLTFMLGPIGLLCYHAVRAGAHEPLDVAVLAPVPKAH
jgi:hypothetical protein